MIRKPLTYAEFEILYSSSPLINGRPKTIKLWRRLNSRIGYILKEIEPPTDEEIDAANVLMDLKHSKFKENSVKDVEKLKTNLMTSPETFRESMILHSTAINSSEIIMDNVEVHPEQSAMNKGIIQKVSSTELVSFWKNSCSTALKIKDINEYLVLKNENYPKSIGKNIESLKTDLFEERKTGINKKDLTVKNATERLKCPKTLRMPLINDDKINPLKLSANNTRKEKENLMEEKSSNPFEEKSNNKTEFLEDKKTYIKTNYLMVEDAKEQLYYPIPEGYNKNYEIVPNKDNNTNKTEINEYNLAAAKATERFKFTDKHHSANFTNVSSKIDSAKAIQSIEENNYRSHISKNATYSKTFYNTIGTEEESFKTDFLKAYRSKPSTNTELNRDVVMVDIANDRKLSFDCYIKDCNFELENFNEVLLKSYNKLTKFKLLEDMLRVEYLKYNNACDIYFKNARRNKNSFVCYAYCKDNACTTFLFKVTENGYVQVLRRDEKISHTIGTKKTFQLRGAQRYVEKAAIFKEPALVHRKIKVNQEAKILEKIGRDQNVKTLTYYRKLRSEALAEFDYHKDPFIDAYVMSQGPYKGYIQQLSTELDVYLYSYNQISILQRNSNFVLKSCDFTLQIDATGSIVSQNISCVKKRILLYSIIGHVADEKLTFSVADGILSNHTAYDIGKFLHHIKMFCSTKKLKWPICKRFITDVSFALIGAIIKECNGMNSVLEYLNACASYLQKPTKNIPFVIIQFCTSHYSKIMVKDIDKTVPESNISLRKFLREALGCAFNFTTLQQLEQWFKYLCNILLSQKFNENVKKNTELLMALAKNETEINHSMKDEYFSDLKLKKEGQDLESIARGSPFRKRFEKIYIESKKQIDVSQSNDDISNTYFSPVFLKFILEKYIAFLPMWTQTLSFPLINKIKRPSNGAVESHFKNLKLYVLNMSSLKLGRFIRAHEKYTRSNLKLVEKFIEQKNGSPIKPGTTIRATQKIENKNKMCIKRNLKSAYFGADSRKKLSQFKESWQKKNKMDKIKQKMFVNEFLSLQKAQSKFKTHKENKNSITNDHLYINNGQQINKVHFNLPIEVLKSVDQTNIEFYLYRLNTLYKYFYGKNPRLDCFITLNDLISLYPDNWLTNGVVDAGMHLLVKELMSPIKLLPCQIENYCFNNVKVLNDAFKSKPNQLIIPQLYESHFYVVILNFDRKYVTCLDPFNNKMKINKFISYYIEIINNELLEEWHELEFPKDTQKDSVNCGIFIIQYIERYLQNESLENLICQEDYREILKTKIVNGSDSMDNICLHCASSIGKMNSLNCDKCPRKICLNCLNRYYKISSENLEEYTLCFKEFKCKICYNTPYLNTSINDMC